MFVKRTDSAAAGRHDNDATLEMESLRSADAAGRATDEPPAAAKKPTEESISLFWRVFGGAILSISALVAINLFNNLSGSISDLRAEVARLTVANAECAKKDDVNSVRVLATTYAGYRAEIDSLKERASKYRLELEEARKDLAGTIDGVRKDHTLATDGLKKELTALDLVKERLVVVTADLKTARDELSKVRNDVDKNQAADHERRDRRDSQMKQLDETFKEMAKTIQETREKLARLEGQQKPAEAPKPKPVTSGDGN